MSENKQDKGFWTFGRIIMGFILIYTVGAIWLYKSTNTWEDRGSFGDMFGSLNALFSALALGAVIYTTNLQRQDLKLQKEMQETQLKELKAQAKSSEKSAEQLEEQQRLLNFQIAQETVLNFINLKNKIIQDLQASKSSNRINTDGYEAFTDVYNRDKTNPVLKKYFQIYFYTLQYITDSKLDDKQKTILGDILSINTHEMESAILYDHSEKNNNQHRSLLLTKYKI
ncbi:hypothetical protein [Paenibacillus sp. An7]|uniref:hypothetical protein n=1 Tax=Paenibacillus sp. An7 TaxID=2689577 RepID=UPI001356B4C4|nr:hypothetical protein [Paenibacillus sp. An7]